MKVNGIFFDGNRNMISAEKVESILDKIDGRIVAKITIDTNSGRGVHIMDIANGIDTITKKKCMDILKELGNDYCVQEWIKPHNSFSMLYPNSINTLRVVSYITESEIKIAPIIMRIGQGGGVIDNAHAGGMFISVDDDGLLGEEAFTEYQDRYLKHPDTGIVFKGYELPCIKKIKKIAVKMHGHIPMFRFVSWDFTVDEQDNPVLLEINLHSQAVWVSQIAHGKSMFGDDTAYFLNKIKRGKK